MLRFHLKRLIADREAKLGRRISLNEVAKETGIHPSTLSRLANHRSTDTTTANLERLCRYLRCGIHELLEYIDDEPKQT